MLKKILVLAGTIAVMAISAYAQTKSAKVLVDTTDELRNDILKNKTEPTVEPSEGV